MKKQGPRALTSEDLRNEALANCANGCVGRELILENARVRIWKTVLIPGERMAYHTHKLDFVWTAISDCNLIVHNGDGDSEKVTLESGEVVYYRIPRKSEAMRAICNVGGEPAAFTVVEFLNSDNSPLPIPEHVRKR